MAQTVKNLPAMQETCVLSLCWEDPLEKGMATHSRILAWRIPWEHKCVTGRQHVSIENFSSPNDCEPKHKLFACMDIYHIV